MLARTLRLRPALYLFISKNHNETSRLLSFGGLEMFFLVRSPFSHFFRYSTQDPEIFRLGIRRAVKAIKNAIGPKVFQFVIEMKTTQRDQE